MKLNFRRSTLFILYVVGFFFALRSALPSYINSSFLKGITGEELVGTIYMICSVLTLVLFSTMPFLVKKIGNYRSILIFIVINIISLLVLAFSNNPYLAIISFVISYSATTITSFFLDIFIEHESSDIETGRIRSYYLTSVNLAWLFSPWLSSHIVNGGDYWKLFIVSSFLLMPVFFIVSYNLKKFSDPDYRSFHFFRTLKESWSKKDIRCILISNFLLQSFFSCMVIYTPIYLNEYIGFSWKEIGLMFTVMLLPFVLIQIPLGRLADKKIGEKELLTFGFIVMSISTGLIAFIEVKTIWIWAILLFLTRVGAATVEVMTETYFFKNISSKNMNLISLFRTMPPFAYIITPIFSTIILLFSSYDFLFMFLAFLMLFGVRYSLAIKDTR